MYRCFIDLYMFLIYYIRFFRGCCDHVYGLDFEVIGLFYSVFAFQVFSVAQIETLDVRHLEAGIDQFRPENRIPHQKLHM